MLQTPSVVPRTSKSHRTAVGYVRVSTTMQSEDGLSLDAQRAAIVNFCAAHNFDLVNIYSDVESGGKADRKGLAKALSEKVDVFVILKFDRLSRSIRHFCQLYEDHFSQDVELIAIREAIRLDSALGRALVNVLLVFAQMEREATSERLRETIAFIQAGGHFFGKVPFGMKAVPAPDNPRFRVLVPDEEEQQILARIKSMLETSNALTEIANRLNEENVTPPQGKKWTKSLLYALRDRQGWQVRKQVNKRHHSDAEVKARMQELRAKGHTYEQVANILNEEGYKPLKGSKFNTVSVCKLLGGVVKTRKLLTPKQYCQQVVDSSEARPSFALLAELLNKNGYQTPRGSNFWWPAQVRELMAGRFDKHYGPKSAA